MKVDWSKYLPSNESVKKPSVIFLIFTICFSFWFVDFWKPYNSAKKDSNFVYDVFNYYSYLPAYVYNKGSFEFNKNIPSGYNPIGPRNKHIPKTTYGMALMYSPFFALGAKIASNSKTPLNGFTEEFVDALHWGSIFYVILGLFFLRRFLLFYFNETVTAITLFATLFGTMLFMYAFSLNEMSHGYLFCLFSIFLYLTHKWHLHQKWQTTLGLGIVIGLISLIRPNEILFFLFFLFWNVKSLSDLRDKIYFFLRNYLHFIIIGCLVVLIWLPQFLFWKQHTGAYFYFSYPGERFFWTDPQIFNILFSYRKGWITYTPLIILSFIGFFFVKKEFPISKGFFVFFTSLIVYVLSCWWDWFFGGCFGARGFCQHIAYLSIPIAFAVEAALYSPAKFVLKGSLSTLTIVFVFSCVCLNIGQSYQYIHRKIHPFAMSEKLYWEVMRTYNYKDEFDWLFWDYIDEPNYETLRSGENRDQ